MRTELLAVALASVLAGGAVAADVYEIEGASGDGAFVINGQTFRPQLLCSDWERGYRVVFLSGMPDGPCGSADLYNIDLEESCPVWCP